MSSQSKRISKSSKTKSSTSAEAKFVRVKDHFLDLLDQHEEDEITYVWFEHDFVTGVTKKLAHAKKANAKE